MPGKPVNKKKFVKVDYASRNGNVSQKVYRGKELEQRVECANKVQLMAPGNVERTTVMRICDANGRRLITPEIFMEIMEVEDIGVGDRITIVPKGTLEHIQGVDEIEDEKTVVEERPINVMGFPYACVCGQLIQSEEEFKLHGHAGTPRRTEPLPKDATEE